MRNRKSNSKAIRGRDFTCSLHKPDCIVTTNPDKLVLIPIITWHFSFQPLNVSILNLKGKYGTRSESRYTCSSHCYIMWCPLAMGIVTSQFPSWRDAVLVMCLLKPLASAFLNVVKRLYHNKIYLQWICKLKLTIVMLLLTPMINRITPELCQWLALCVWWHMLAFITYTMTCNQAYVA